MKEKIKRKNGITLIALVITIIVMLILVAVTISLSVNGGLFNYAGKAASQTNEAIEKEKKLGNIETGLSTEELIALVTTDKEEDLAKLRLYFTGPNGEGKLMWGEIYEDEEIPYGSRVYYKNNDIISDARTSITEEYEFDDGTQIIKYHNNYYKLLVEEVAVGQDEYDYKYTNVEEFIKLDVTQAEIINDSILIGNVPWIEKIQNKVNNYNLLEDFVITSNDTSIVTVDGHDLTSVTEGTTTITLTGKKSGKTKNVQVVVETLNVEAPPESKGK